MTLPRPPRLRAALWVIRFASLFVPRERRAGWREQWVAEVTHRWQAERHRPARDLVLWSFGAFSHAWYLFRTEFTMDNIWQDIRYAFRSLRNGPGLIAMAVVSLGIGIGATTAIFSAVDVFMLRPLPYADADRLMKVYTSNEDRGWTTVNPSVPDYLDFREQSQTMDIAAYDAANFNLSGDDRPERLIGMQVSANFFSVLGTQPALGRGFTPDEETVGRHRVIAISDGLWHRRFGADSSVLGETVLLDGEAHTIVGVMPAGFWFESPAYEMWAPLPITGEESRMSYYLDLLARVRDGRSVDQAQEEMRRIATGLAAAYPETSAGNSARVITLHEDIFDEGFKMGSLISSVAVVFVLLIVCVNVANLLLTRAAGRNREIAVRGALGAGRMRIVRQLLTESLLISVIGGIVGVAFSVFAIRVLVSWMPAEFPRVAEIGLDGRVFVFATAITLMTGVLFGLAPALQSLKTKFTDALKEGGRTGSGASSGRLRKVLVVGEVAMAVTLLVSSTLLVKGYMGLRDVDNGYDPTDVLTVRLTLPEADYPDSTAIERFYRAIIPRFEAMPGVVSVGATTVLPDQGNRGAFYSIPGEDVEGPGRQVVGYRVVHQGYFEAFDIPVVRGRGFEPSDAFGAPPVALINQLMAERHWPDGDPIGQEIELSSGRRQIVGVVQTIRDLGPDSPGFAMLYLTAMQRPVRSLAWLIETTSPPATLADAVRAEVRAVDPNLPVYSVASMQSLVMQALDSENIMAKVMASLAGIALILAIGGVYGVMAYSVSQRTQEMGIRLALGAQSTNIISMVVRQGTMLAVIGVVTGIVVALGVTRGLTFFLYGVNPFDPLTFAGVALLLLGAAVAATYFPARRAVNVDPIVALRSE
ncbi:MAG: ABC transporter permease [Gemmatimonadetes bacterium]|nr:ABC transporter permease [Gemmatimonadota bacterium]